MVQTTIRMPKELKQRLGDYLGRDGNMQASINEAISQWLDGRGSNRITAPPAASAPPSNLIKSLATITSKSAQLAKAAQDLANQIESVNVDAATFTRDLLPEAGDLAGRAESAIERGPFDDGPPQGSGIPPIDGAGAGRKGKPKGAE